MAKRPVRKKHPLLNALIGIGLAVFLIAEFHPFGKKEHQGVSAGRNTEQLADSMAASYGWTGTQETCLDELWGRETAGTWDPLIMDPVWVRGGRAFGIAQALNHGGSGTAVTDPVVHVLDGAVVTSEYNVTVNAYPDASANAGNASAQIAWGLAYIKDKYGSPCNAWTDSNYDANGY